MGDEQWTDADDALLTHEALPESHPSRVARRFNNLLYVQPLPVDDLAELVYPGQESAWGDFAAARAYFVGQSLAISNRSLRPRGADHVAYVKLVNDTGAMISDGPRTDIIGYVTLAWLSGVGEWRVVSVGGPPPPQSIPSGKGGEHPPRYDTDSTVDFHTD